MRFLSRGPEATRAAARELGCALGAEGAVVALVGGLGTGKTVFAKGVAEGLGIPAALLASPTFTVAHEVPSPRGLRLVHADLFRVESAAELEAAGWLDWLGPGTVLLVEWADRWPDELPGDRLELALSVLPEGEGLREVRAAARGPRAGMLLARWRARLQAAGVPLTDPGP